MIPKRVEWQAQFLEGIARGHDRFAFMKRAEVEESMRSIADAEGLAGGYEFLARELRYDARGGMTRAQAAEQVIDVLTEIMEAGAKPGRERDDMAEEQGETWDETRKGDGRC